MTNYEYEDPFFTQPVGLIETFFGTILPHDRFKQFLKNTEISFFKKKKNYSVRSYSLDNFSSIKYISGVSNTAFIEIKSDSIFYNFPLEHSPEMFHVIYNHFTHLDHCFYKKLIVNDEQINISRAVLHPEYLGSRLSANQSNIIEAQLDTRDCADEVARTKLYLVSPGHSSSFYL